MMTKKNKSKGPSAQVYILPPVYSSSLNIIRRSEKVVWISSTKKTEAGDIYVWVRIICLGMTVVI